MRRRHVLGFALFCLLSGSGWLVDNAYPSPLPALERQALHDLVIALAAAAFLIFKRRSPQPIPLLRIATASILLLGLPASLNELAHSVSATSGLALFALVPLFLIVGAIAFNPSSPNPQPSRALMTPALIGFVGALLLPAFQFPSTTHGAFLFALVFAAALSTAAGSLWIYTLLRGHDLAPALAIFCGANALFLGIVAPLTSPIVSPASSLPHELLRALDLPQLLLFLWLLRELDPIRFGSRFLLVPLLSVLEGVILVHPPIDPRLGLAALFMAIGGVTLLFANAPADAESPPSLNLR
ncbi:MAG: hypothetical protein ABI197_09560 [Granulicella sp.]